MALAALPRLLYLSVPCASLARATLLRPVCLSVVMLSLWDRCTPYLLLSLDELNMRVKLLMLLNRGRVLTDPKITIFHSYVQDRYFKKENLKLYEPGPPRLD